MKVSFSLSSSKPSNPTSPDHNNQPNTKQFITEFDPSKPQPNPPITIPPIPNEWNPTSPLNLHTTKDNKPVSKPMSAIDQLMLMKLKTDLKRLPDHKGLDEFKDVSVNEFATAYLKGYGWVEGRGIGKNAKKDVKSVEFRNRSGRHGLGFVASDNVGC